MRHPEFCFVDLAISGATNRNHVVDLNDLSIPADAVDCYATMFRFKQEYKEHVESTGSVRGADRFAVWSDFLWFDIDSEDLRDATINMQALLRGLQSMGVLDHTVVFFSGSKGYHVGIDSAAFGFEPSQTLPDQMRRTSEAITALFSVKCVDMKIYNHNRLWRVPNTVHGKTRLRKTALDPIKAIDMTVDRIKKIASFKGKQKPRYITCDEAAPMDVLVRLREKANADVAEKSTWDSPPIDEKRRAVIEAGLTHLLECGVEKGARDNEAHLRASECHKVGKSQEECSDLLTVWNALNHPPLEDGDLQRVIDSAYTGPGYDYGTTNSESLAAARKAGKRKLAQEDQQEPPLLPLSDDGPDDIGLKRSPAQLYHDGSIYYAVNKNGHVQLVGPGPRLIELDDARKMGMRIADDVTPMTMQFRRINAYMDDTRRVTYHQVFQAVRAYLKKYLMLTDDRNYDYLALWILGSYCFMAFETYPYIVLRGEAGSGKTVVMARVASLAFNASAPSTLTSSALFYITRYDAGVVCLDEAERVVKQKGQDESGIDGGAIIREGYWIGGSHIKSVKFKNDFIPTRFPCYSPKMLAAINDIGRIDVPLRTRCYQIDTRPITLSEKHGLGHYSSNRPSIKELEASLRNDLYTVTLQSFCEPPSELEATADMINRTRDLWYPILAMAQLVDESTDGFAVTDTMKELAGISERATAMETGVAIDLSVPLLKALRVMFDDASVRPITHKKIADGVLVYSVGNIRAYLHELPEFKPRGDVSVDDSQRLTQLIVELGFESGQGRFGGEPIRYYLFNRAQFDSVYAQRVGQQGNPTDHMNDEE